MKHRLALAVVFVGMIALWAATARVLGIDLDEGSTVPSTLVLKHTEESPPCLFDDHSIQTALGCRAKVRLFDRPDSTLGHVSDLEIFHDDSPVAPHQALRQLVKCVGS